MKQVLSENILDEVEVFTESKLKRKEDVQLILSASIKSGSEEKFEQLVFTSKYLQGLMRVLKKGAEISEIESLDNVKKDLTENMEKVVEQIREILDGESADVKTYFEQTYLLLTHVSFQNLNELLADLEWVKKFLNYRKRKS